MKQADKAHDLASDAMADTAARWFARRRQGLRPQEDAEFSAWLEADPEHRTAYDGMTRAWEIAGAAAVEPAIAAMRSEALMLRSEPRRRSPLLGAGIAAALVAMIGAGSYQFLNQAGAPPSHTVQNTGMRLIQTAVGERSTVTLEDGSVVTLNTASRLQVRFAAGRRDVVLLAGQALFQVAKDHSRPFVVTAGDRQVVAIGTEFEVRLDKREVRVALLEGRVRVEPIARKDGVSQSPRMTPASVLEPGEQLVAALSGRVSVRATDVGELTGWREGRVRFDETPLADAVAEMNRYSLKPIVITDPRIASIRVSGAFRTGQSNSFVDSISEVFPVRSETGADAIRLRHAD